MTRALPAVLGCLCLLLGGCSGVTASPPAPEPSTPPAPQAASDPAAPLQRYYDQRVEWQACQGAYECGTVDVPLDYADPLGPSITLDLLRARAGNTQARLGSLVVNPGGPGGSGVDYAARADAVVSPAVRQVYDVVGFDPRGVARSEPVECMTDAEFDESLNTEDATPDTPQEVQAYLEGTAEFQAGCLARSADLLGHVGTADVARDLDIIRAALGDDVLSYLGASYGTSIGAEYAEQFPDRVGRLVLDGALDPTLSEREVLLGQAVGFEQSLAAFAADCVARGCSVGGTEQQVLDAVSLVLERSDEAPIPTSTRPLTQILAVYGIITPLYLPAQQGYPALEAGLTAALDGDGSVLLGLADAYLRRGPDGSFPDNQWDVIQPVSCLDRPSQATVADVQAELAQFEEASPRLGATLAWSLLGCSGWPVDASGLTAPVRAAGAAPILVVGNTGDPVTPYAWAQSLADQLQSGVLLTYRARQHLAYREGSRCVDAAVDAYLIGGAVPSPGTVCD